MLSVVLASFLLLANPAVSSPVSSAEFSADFGQQTSRQPRLLDSANSLNVSKIFEDIGQLLKGASDFIKGIVEVKRNTILPVVESVVATKKALIESPLLSNILDTKRAIVDTFAQSAPAILTIVNSAAKVKAQVFKVGVCTLVCPILGSQDCTRDHCTTRQPTSAPRVIEIGESDYGDYQQG